MSEELIDLDGDPDQTVGLVTFEETAEDGFALAYSTVEDCLSNVRRRLAELRQARQVVNDEIRGLVGEEDVLSRMLRVAAKVAKPDE